MDGSTDIDERKKTDSDGGGGSIKWSAISSPVASGLSGFGGAVGTCVFFTNSSSSCSFLKVCFFIIVGLFSVSKFFGLILFVIFCISPVDIWKAMNVFTFGGIASGVL